MFVTRFSKSGGIKHVLQIAAHRDDVNAGLAARAKRGFAEFLRRLRFALRHDQSRNPGRFRNLQPSGLGAAGNHQLDLRVQLSGRDLFDQIPQRRPAAGNQHGQS